jgi:hypothetical protein
VAECSDLPRPKVCSTAGFKTHAAARKSIEEPNNFGPAKLSLYRQCAVRGNTMNLKDMI